MKTECQRGGVKILTWSLRRRQHHDQQPGKLHVLGISIEDTIFTKWKAIARAIYTQGTEFGLNSSNFQVEFFNYNQMLHNRSSPIPKIPSLLSDLEAVQGLVVSELQQKLPLRWTSVAFHMRRGHTQDSTASKPSILIFCKPFTAYDFEGLLRDVMKIATAIKSRVEVEILPGEISLCPALYNAPRNLNLSAVQPYQGASIGVPGDDLRAGTLGGYVRLNLPKMAPMAAFLTCYHVIRSADKATAELEDREGVKIGQPHASLDHGIVNYPATFDSNAARARYDKDPGFKNQLAQVNDLIKNSAKGKVIAASGLRVSQQNHKLDWALVQDVANYSSKLKPIPESLVQPDDLPSGYNLNQDSIIRNVGFLELDDWVAKLGRTSGWTTGTVNNMKRTWIWPEGGRVTEEIEVMGLSQDFAEPGDSGSLVHNKDGALVGLLFAKDTYANDFDSGIVSRIQDVMDDIKRMTGGGFISLE